MTKIQMDFLEAISGIVRQEQLPILTELVLKEAKDQAVLSLIDKGPHSLQVISSNVQLIWEQNELGIVLQGIPYIILKGTAASIYYPEPLRRALGDIDIIVRPMDFSQAYIALNRAGYISSESIEGDERHVHFYKNGILIELHRRFATLQTKEQEQLLDGWIYEGLNAPVIEHIQRFDFPRLDDNTNGLVLLTHINQHLEEGLGFRQLLDWCMFVNKCLPDEKWADFKKKTDLIGLTTLAKVSARLGQKYLGLSEDFVWCQDADDETVEELLRYVFDCGNFGLKDSKNNSVVMVMSHGRGVVGFFRNLQRQGKINWKALEKHQWLATFAWAYQLGRYIILGLKQNSLKEIRENYKVSKRRNRMLDKLEATRTAMKKKQ